MPFMILLIAALHAVPILVVAGLTCRRRPTWIAAAVMAVIGAITGASPFTAADLLAVALATWFSMSRLPQDGQGGAPAPAVQMRALGQAAGRATKSLVIELVKLVFTFLWTLTKWGGFVAAMYFGVRALAGDL